MTVRRREYRNHQGQQIWDYDFWYNGVRYRRAGFASKAEATIAETRAKGVVYSGRRIIRPSTFEDLSKAFLEYRRGRVAPNTYERDERRIPILKAFFGAKPIVSITTSELDRYLNERINEGKASRTVNLEINLLSSIFEYAVDHGFAFENPARRIKRLKVVQEEPWIPSNEQFQALVDAARRTETGLELATWIIFRGYTGTRPAESFFLEWSDIDFNRGQIHIRPKVDNQLKNRRFRVMPMHEELKAALLEWREEWGRAFDGNKKRHNWVFFNPRFPHLRCQRFEKSYPRAQRLAGLTEKMTSHCLRHFFISKAVESGINSLVIARWVGHASTRMIEQIYGHLSPDFKQSEMKKLQLGLGRRDEKQPEVQSA